MKYWLWLSQLPYIGLMTANRLLNMYKTPEAIFNLTESDVNQCHFLNTRQRRSILENKDIGVTDCILDKCVKSEISIMSQGDIIYPQRFRNHDDSPLILYYKGKLKTLDKTVAIVGARRCTQEMKYKTVEITNEYISHNYDIVSGMAKGIDSYAHTACIKAAGYTVAVVASGLDICYPSEHLKLMESIIDNGVIISEYPPQTSPAKYRFPQRNRLISALSDEVVIIGASKGSGALITAEYARKYDKMVKMIQ